MGTVPVERKRNWKSKSISLGPDDHIIGFDELEFEDDLFSDEIGPIVLICTLCESAQQFKHTRWIRSYLPGIRVGICAYCSNYRFIAINNQRVELIAYYHPDAGIITNKSKPTLDIKISKSIEEMFK